MSENETMSWRERRLRWGGRKPPLGLRFVVETKRGELGRLLGLPDEWEVTDNALLDEGERNVLDLYFRNNAAPSNFYLGLTSTGGLLQETHTLANVTEPAQAGYARGEITRSLASWSAPTLDTGDHKTTAAQKSFLAAATWTTVTECFLSSTSSGAVGSVILSAALSTPRSLVSGDTLNVTLSVKAQ